MENMDKSHNETSVVQMPRNTEKIDSFNSTNDINCEEIKTYVLEIKKNSEDSCCSKDKYLDFYTQLIWPLFIITLLAIFRRHIIKILDLLVEIIPNIKTLNAAGIEVSFRDNNSYAQEFVQDVVESNEDVQNPSPYADLNEAYRDFQNSNKDKSLMALAKLRTEIIMFEELAIRQLSQIVKRAIVTGKTISLSGKKLSADGYFSFEGTFWLIEVKLLKSVEVRILTKFINMIRDLEEQKTNLSPISNMSISEVRGVLIIPKNIEIKPLAKSLILAHRLVVYELDKETGRLINLFDEY